MITIYKSSDNLFNKLEAIEDGAWVNMINPTESEITQICTRMNVERDFLTAPLDPEERAHIEFDEKTGNLLIVTDIPFLEISSNSRKYETYPLGIVYTDRGIITVCLKENIVTESFESNTVKTFYTFKKSRFVLLLLYKNSSLYLNYLKQIDKMSSAIELELHKSMKNKELLQLMDLEKSLVYFSTSLRSNEIVLEKLMRYDLLQKYDEDKELLEDTIIENKQAIEMAKIYSDILSGTMDAFASIISNNLNIVMKLLTSVTIVMAIPTMISGFFGMNVPVPLENNPLAFMTIFAFTTLICALVAIFMARKKLF